MEVPRRRTHTRPGSTLTPARNSTLLFVPIIETTNEAADYGFGNHARSYARCLRTSDPA